MTKFVVIPRGDGFISHQNVDVDGLNLPANAEIYDDKREFEARLSELSDDNS